MAACVLGSVQSRTVVRRLCCMQSIVRNSGGVILMCSSQWECRLTFVFCVLQSEYSGRFM